jgi:site-specific DNA recombinase
LISEEYQNRIKDGGVLIYLRKSREETEGALTNHKMTLESLCKKHGWSFIIKKEIGSSDTLKFRDVMLEILEDDIPSGIYSAIVVMDQDRLSRNTADSEHIKEILAQNDILVVEATENVIDFNKETDEMVYDFKAFIAKQEFRLIKKRLKEGKKAGAIRGHWVNGKPPYGYIYNPKTKKLDIDKVTSEVVKSIFDDAYHGLSTSEIAHKLNRKGVLSPKKTHWNNTTIQRMLHQEVYLGNTIFGKSSGSGHKNKKTTPLKVKDKHDWIIVNNTHEPLVTQDMFDYIGQQLSRRYKVIATRKSKIAALSGLIKCGQCGAGLYIQRKDNNENLVKGCWKKDPFGNKCNNKGVAESKIVEVIIEKIKWYRDDLAKIIEDGQGQDKQKINLRKKVISLEKELKVIKSKFDQLADFLEEGIYTKDEYLSRKEKLINRQKDVEYEITLLNEQFSRLDVIKDNEKVKLLDLILNNFDTILDEEDRNKIFKSIISHVELTKTNDADGDVIVNFL